MCVNATRAVPGHDQGLGKALGLVVDRAGADRVYVAPIALPLGMLQRVAVALRGGGVQIAGAMAGGNFKGVFHANRANLQCLYPQAEILRWTGRRSKVEDVIHWAHVEGLADVPLLKAEAWLIGQVRNVIPAAGAEVIDAFDGVALAQQAVGEVRTEKSGGPGNNNAHCQKSMLLKQFEQFMGGVSSAPTQSACVVCPAATDNLPAGPCSHT